MELGTTSVTHTLAEWARLVTVTPVRFLGSSLVGVRAIPMRRQAVVMLALIAMSLVIALIVALAAVAIERSRDAACLTSDSAPCSSDAIEWCKFFNGRPICIGEPD